MRRHARDGFVRGILDITWAWSIYLGMTGMLTIVAGSVSDRIWQWCGRERLLVAGYALNALCTFGYLFVNTPTDLFLGAGGAWGSVGPFRAPHGRRSTRAILLANKRRAIHGTWLPANSVLILATAILLGGYIVNHYSFSALFLTMGTVQVIATLHQARILRKG